MKSTFMVSFYLHEMVLERALLSSVVTTSVRANPLNYDRFLVSIHPLPRIALITKWLPSHDRFK